MWYVCHYAGAKLSRQSGEQITYYEFSGPHPAELVGIHIHFLKPISQEKTVWHIGYQDVIAIGTLFTTGILATHRVIALNGPHVRDAIDLKGMMILVVTSGISVDVLGHVQRRTSGDFGAASFCTVAIKLQRVLAGDWHYRLAQWMGASLAADAGWVSKMALIACYFVLIYALVFIVVCFLEVLFAMLCKHEINEGFSL